LAAIAAASAAVAAAGAAQWIVDDDGPANFASIQAAINAPYVLVGDTIVVRAGTYRENLYLESKDLAIRSERGPFVTILDGQESGSVVSLLDRGAGTRIEGFTIRNGRDQTGGGIWIFGGAPVITRNVIESNRAVGGSLGYGYGGGIEVYSSAAIITRNVIRANIALDGGGGIDVYYAGPSTAGTCCPVIAQNTIVENVVTAPTGMGGGILAFASEPDVASTILLGNRAAMGGGIFVERVQGNSDQPAATDNILFGNLPDAVDSNGSWHLPASNLEVDPRLGPGGRIALWPRSGSPALDAAGGGLPAGPDLIGTTSPADGDVDGAADPDIGAIESLGEVTSVTAARDGQDPSTIVLSWDGSVNPGALFNVYGSDDDPFATDGGTCLAVFLATTSHGDPALPPPGGIRYYLVTQQQAVEGSRGLRSDGTSRPQLPSCTSP
jgi:hypothetical protein